METIHSLRTEAERLGVSPSALSQAVAAGRTCGGRDVMSRARFDPSGRCVGFVPAANPQTFYKNPTPETVPLTKAELDAVESGVLTEEEAQVKARARIELAAEPDAEPDDDGPDDDGAAVDVSELVERRAVELVARGAPAVAVVELPDPADAGDDPEDDPFEECVAWFESMPEEDREEFIRSYGVNVIAEAVEDGKRQERRRMSDPSDVLREALASVDPDQLREIVGAEVHARMTHRAYEIANDLLEEAGLDPIHSAEEDGEEVFRNGSDEEDDEFDADGEFGADDALDLAAGTPGILAEGVAAFFHGFTLGIFEDDEEEADGDDNEAPADEAPMKQAA